MVEDQCFLHHLEFLNPWCALPSRHYITLTQLSSYNAGIRTSFVGLIQHEKQEFEGVVNTCEIDKQRVHVILCDNVSNMKKAVDDFSHTLQLTVHEGLLSQRNITDSPARARKVGCQCCNNICRTRKSHMKVYTLFRQINKPSRGTAWMQVLFFLMQLYYPGKY